MPALTPDPSLRRSPPPGAREAVVRAGRRRRGRLLVPGVLAAAALLAVPFLALGSPGADDTLRIATSPVPTAVPVTDCPQQVDAAAPQVPEQPVGVDVSDRLVPSDVPLAVDVCRYRTDGSYEGRVRISRELERVPPALAVPLGEPARRCPRAVPDPAPYLVHLLYPDDAGVWLATTSQAGSCAPRISNGVVTSGADLGGEFATSYLIGSSWYDRRTVSTECGRAFRDRAGQEREVVPTGWDRVTVCGPGSRVLNPADADRVAALLQGAPREQATSIGFDCTGVALGRATDPTLVFGYPEGRDVVVSTAAGCRPNAANGWLGVRLDPAAEAELLELLEGD